MNTLADRLKFALEKSGKKKTDLWKGCRLSSGAISHWFNNPSTQLKGKNLLCASRILGVRPEWLETGEGEISLTEREKLINQIIESLHSMPEDDVKHVSQLCGRLAKQERRSGEPDRRKIDLGFNPERRHFYPAPNFPEKKRTYTDRRKKSER